MDKRCLASAFAIAALALSRDAGAVKVAVRAGTTITARVQNDGDAQIIRGTLGDDVNAPVVSGHVEIEVLPPGGGKPIDLPLPRPCSLTAGGHPPHAAPDAYVLDTDAQGVFCVRTSGLGSRGTLRIRFAGEGMYAPSALDVPFDADRPIPSLAWSPAPDVIDLDVPVTKVSVVASSRDGGGRPLENVPLAVLESKRVVARARTDERGRATFDLPAASLGKPGPTELEARAEDPGASLAPIKAHVVRTARVALTASAPTGAIVPHDGWAFEVAADTSRGPAEGGAIEARIGNEIVGVGNVANGRARVVATFDVPVAGTVDVALQFLPNGPELRPGEPLVLHVPVKPPSLWRRAPLLAVAALLVLWLARGWRRPPRSATAAAKPPPPEARLPDFVVEAQRGATGWSGTVLDAHEKRPIADATVAVLQRDFLGERRVVETRVEHDGKFWIETAWQPERVLVVESPLHAKLEKALPKPAKMTIALVSRRRALLDRLVGGARRVLGIRTGEPTPAQVARIAEDQSRAPVARWAKAVEAAAYGRDPVDATAEASVAALEPDATTPDRRLRDRARASRVVVGSAPSPAVA